MHYVEKVPKWFTALLVSNILVSNIPTQFYEEKFRYENTYYNLQLVESSSEWIHHGHLTLRFSSQNSTYSKKVLFPLCILSCLTALIMRL